MIKLFLKASPFLVLFFIFMTSDFCYAATNIEPKYADPLARKKRLSTNRLEQRDLFSKKNNFSSLKYAEILKNASVIVKRDKTNIHLTQYSEDIGSIDGFEPLDIDNTLFGEVYDIKYDQDQSTLKNGVTKDLIYRLYQKKGIVERDTTVKITDQAGETEKRVFDFTQLLTQELRNQFYNARMKVPFDWDEIPSGVNVLFHASSRDETDVKDTIKVKVLTEKDRDIKFKEITESSIDLMISYILPGSENESIEYFDISDDVEASFSVITGGRMNMETVIGLIELIHDKKRGNVYSLEIVGPQKDLEKQKALFKAIGKSFYVKN